MHVVFVDRDGVISRKLPEGLYVQQPSDLELLPGSADAIAKLNADGRKVILVTNQRGIALGILSEQELLRVHESLGKRLAAHGGHLDAIYYCPHDVDPQCRCRKPAGALFERAFQDFLCARRDNSVAIGDSLSDIEAGRLLGMRTIFIKSESVNRKPGTGQAAALADATAKSLEDAVDRLLRPYVPSFNESS